MNDFICLTVRQIRTIKNDQKGFKDNEEKVVTAFMMAALGSSLVFTQAVMAADTTAKQRLQKMRIRIPQNLKIKM